MLRAIEREPEGFALMLAELASIANSDARLRTMLASLHNDLLANPEQREVMARRVAQKLVLLVQGCLLLQDAPSSMAEAFISSRSVRNAVV